MNSSTIQPKPAWNSSTASTSPPSAPERRRPARRSDRRLDAPGRRAKRGTRRRSRACWSGGPPALGHHGPVDGPDEVVQHRGDSEARVGFGHDPGTPAGDGAGALANGVSDLHQRAPANRTAAGGITPSTSP